MAITQNLYTGNGSTTNYSFTFPYLEETDVKVSLDGVATTAYSFANATTLQFNTAPGNGVSIRIYRDTDDESLSATFYPGSAIRAQDLNDNFTQNLYVTQEVNNNAVTTDGANPMVGDLDMGGYEVINLGTPTSDGAAVNKQYVDSRLGNLDIPGFTRWTLTAVGGETTLSGAGTTGGTLAYSANREQVFLNGAQQQRGVDYTADNGTSVVFNVALTAGDVVEIICVNNLNTGTTAQAQDVSFVQSGAGAVTRSVENKLRDVVSVKDFGAVGDGVTDDTAAIQAAFDAVPDNGVLTINAGTYKLSSTVTVSSKGVVVKAYGAKFIQTVNSSAFVFNNTSDATVATLSADYTIGSTSLSVTAMSSALAEGTVFKVISNSVDPYNRDSGSFSTQYRVQEWAVAGAGSTTSSISLVSPLRFTKGVNPISVAGDESLINSFTTAQNAKVIVPISRAIKWEGGQIAYEDGNDATFTASAFSIVGYLGSSITDLSITRGYGPGISVNGCYKTEINGCRISNLNDNIAANQFGYGIADAGWFTTVNSCYFANVRHGYTTNAQRIAADSNSLSSGRTVGAVVSNCSGLAKNQSIFDTHQDADDVKFIGCTVNGGAAFGFTARGKKVSFNSCSALGCSGGLSVFTLLENTEPDDDGFTAYKSDAFTTCFVDNFTAHVTGLPFNASFATVQLANANCRSTSHKLVTNESSDVTFTGNLSFLTTSYNGQYSITQNPGDSIFNSNHSGTHSTVAINRISNNCKATIDCSAATSTGTDLNVFSNTNAGGQVIIEGSISLILSTAFDQLFSGNLGNAISGNGYLSWQVNGAADNTVSSVELRSLKARILAQSVDKSVFHDWRTSEPSKTIQARPATSFAGTGSSVADALVIPYQAVEGLKELDSHVIYSIWLRKTGTTGSATVVLNTGTVFYDTVTIGATAGVVKIDMHFTTVSANTTIDGVSAVSQYLNTGASYLSGSSKTRSQSGGAFSDPDKFVTFDIDASVGDSVILENYEISSNNISTGLT